MDVHCSKSGRYGPIPFHPITISVNIVNIVNIVVVCHGPGNHMRFYVVIVLVTVIERQAGRPLGVNGFLAALRLLHQAP